MREEVVREDVTRAAVIKEEVIREKVIKEEVVREKVIREEWSIRLIYCNLSIDVQYAHQHY